MAHLTYTGVTNLCTTKDILHTGVWTLPWLLHHIFTCIPPHLKLWCSHPLLYTSHNSHHIANIASLTCQLYHHQVSQKGALVAAASTYAWLIRLAPTMIIICLELVVTWLMALTRGRAGWRVLTITLTHLYTVSCLMLWVRLMNNLRIKLTTVWQVVVYLVIKLLSYTHDIEL